jgi:hypothetical protein
VAPAPAEGATAPVVTAAVQVTSDPSYVRAHSSPQVARNPKTGELVIVDGNPRGSRKCEVFISRDEGRSWFPGGSPMVEPFTDCTLYGEFGPYASMAYSSDGTLFMSFVGSEIAPLLRDDVPRHVFLARSTDGGRSFFTTRVFEAPAGNKDRALNKAPTLALDPSDSKRVYVGWGMGIFAGSKEKRRSMVASSADAGATFAEAVDVSDDQGGIYPSLAVGPDGVVHGVYWARSFPVLPPNRPVPGIGEPGPVLPVYYVRSTDHGKTWTRVAIDPGSQRDNRSPVIVADPKSSAVYMTWWGHRNPNNAAAGFNEDRDIFFRASHDGGKSWDERITLNDDYKQAGLQNQFDPGIALAPNGRVDIAWYDGRHSPSQADDIGSGLQDVYYSSSSDQGRTFTPNLRITDRSIDRTIGVWGNNIGSRTNVGITSTDGSVYFAWQDSRNGNRDNNSEDIYAASLSLTGSIVASPSKESLSWGRLLAGAALGVGLSMVLALAMTRRAPGTRPPHSRQ